MLGTASRRRLRLPGGWLALAAACALGLTACDDDVGPLVPPAAPAAITSPPARPPVTLLVGGFSAAREVLQTRLLPLFDRTRQRSHPTELAFRTTFAGSDALVDTLTSDFPADVAVLASPRDLETLRAAGATTLSRCAHPSGSTVCRSLVVLAVRKGNPKGIRDWTDLTRPGVRIVTPDPVKSGGGLWNVCAAYGAALRGHAGVPANDPAAAHDFLARLSANVVARAASSNDSFCSFQDGLGDVAITYECEVTLAWMFGHDDERVIPSSTLLVEYPAVLLDRNADAHGVRREARKLLRFLFTEEAQQQFATCGLRPADPTVAAAHEVQFPLPQDLWTIDYLGGWGGIARDVLGDTDALAPRASPGK